MLAITHTYYGAPPRSTRPPARNTSHAACDDSGEETFDNPQAPALEFSMKIETFQFFLC
jgi:hypothetical protein